MSRTLKRNATQPPPRLPPEFEFAIRSAVAVLEPELARSHAANLAESDRRDLVEDWTAKLYARWYTRWADASGSSDTRVRPQLVATLRAAHADSARWEEGWVTERVSSAGRVVASRGGRRRVLDPVDYLLSSRPALAPRPGDPLLVTARRDTLDFQPGFWVTHSVGWGGRSQGDRLLRLYWNVGADGVAELVARLTSELNRTDEAYGIKCPVERAGYARVDSVVAFIPSAAFDKLRSSIRRVHALLANLLRPDTPPLTQRLAAGLALAEDPGGSNSFGTKRCRLIAETLSTARECNADAALVAVADAFAAHGVDPRRPHLEPPAETEYRL